MDSQKEDVDTRGQALASLYLCMVGVGYLFPFSALTNPVDYWHILFPDFNIEFPLTTVYMWSNLIALGLIVTFGGTPNFTRRIVGGFIGQFAVLIFVPTSYFLHLSEGPNELLVLGSTVVVAVVTAFLDSAVIGLSSQYPLRVQEFFQLGVGVSTLIGSAYRDLTKAAFPADAVVQSTLLYFYAGALTIAMCIVCYFQLLKLPLSRKMLQDNARAGRHDVGEVDALLGGPGKARYGGESTIQREQEEVPVSKLAVLKKTWKNLILISLLFISTLALWPPLITEIPSYNFPGLGASWWPLLLLTLFSMADVCGRFMVRWRGCLHRDNLWVAILLRTVLAFPLIICSVQGIFFTHDAWSVLFVFCLGWTNGYLGTLTIVTVNELVEPEELKVAGLFASFFLNTGLVLGATAGLVMSKLVLGDSS